MATSLATRIQRLEDTSGGGECPRCSGVVGILLNGEFSNAHKNGEPMSEDAWRDFEAEEEGGCCPQCGEKPESITVGWPEGLPG